MKGSKWYVDRESIDAFMIQDDVIIKEVSGTRQSFLLNYPNMGIPKGLESFQGDPQTKPFLKRKILHVFYLSSQNQSCIRNPANAVSKMFLILFLFLN